MGRIVPFKTTRHGWHGGGPSGQARPAMSATPCAGWSVRGDYYPRMTSLG